MVQYRGRAEFSNLLLHDWKLMRREDCSREQLRTELKLKGHHISKSAAKSLSHEQLQDRLSRVDRGLMLYGRESEAELRDLCQKRNIPSTSTTTKPQLISALEKADEDRTFLRFMDLPPELRTRIYDFYFEPLHRVRWDVAPYTIPPPPITIVSKQLRLESHPLFYNL